MTRREWIDREPNLNARLNEQQLQRISALLFSPAARRAAEQAEAEKLRQATDD